MTYPDDCRFKDAVGRTWVVVHTVTTPKNERLVLIRLDKVLTNVWAIAIDNLDGTAMILEKDGFTTLYYETRDMRK